MTDISERLRDCVNRDDLPDWKLVLAAADRIEKLEAALQLYAGLKRDGIKWEPLNDNGGVARAALGEKKDG